MTMREDEPARRSSRQKLVGAALRDQTRRRILEAAGAEFVAHGYAGTSVARLAAAAEVSVQTLYLAWGSKRELLRAYLVGALAGSARSPEDAAQLFDGLDARARVTELARVVTEVAGRAAPAWRVYRDAAAVDPQIAADWNELQLLRHGLFARILAAVPTERLREGLTHASAVDTAWAIASPDSYELLSERLGYDGAAFRDWLGRTLAAALLADPDGR